MAELRRRDPVLGPKLAAMPVCLLGRRGKRPHFEALARSITFQQLAGRAASAIWERTRALVDGPFTPEAVLAVDEAALRGAGLSGAKTASILDLAARVASGEVRLHGIHRAGDDEIVERLVVVRGIGRWTAEMFLIFQLGRLDVWPTGDLAVRNGYARLHDLSVAPTAKELEVLGDPHRPWRSVLAWYCWRATDAVVPA